MRGAHLRERVKSVRAGEQAEGEQQRERAEARHHQIDVAGAHVLRDAMVRHHQRPRGERHELPGEQERESIVGKHDQRHAGEKGGIERQHALRRCLRARRSRARTGSRSSAPRSMTTRKNAESASRRKCAPSHGTPSGSVRLARALPRRRRCAVAATSEIAAIDRCLRRRRCASPPPHARSPRQQPQARAAPPRRQARCQRHGVVLLSRTPRPPEWLARVVGDELDAERIEGGDELHQRIDVAADHALARFHALDGRQRQPGRFSELALINAEKRARSPELAGGDHRADVRIDV